MTRAKSNSSPSFQEVCFLFHYKPKRSSNLSQKQNIGAAMFSNRFSRLPSSTPDSASSGFINKPLKPATVKLCHGSTANQSACRFTGFNSCLKSFYPHHSNGVQAPWWKMKIPVIHFRFISRQQCMLCQQSCALC